ncbi:MULTISPECIES: hypothetical protein [unclassified Streptomyces]|uniref:hypothetical protein n=1 Tax=unclassified Streptomyces TaxID=2593676 RepID=UPI000A7C084F|nr:MULTISPECIES: hypothetical protein [unclassified Streptomyces]
MTEREAGSDAVPDVSDAPSGAAPGERYEPPPSMGKLLLWILVFVLAAVVVVAGGVYFT